ncbi:hypothetical protein WR25_08715 [Diploscapter pachys]|uniref:Methyltransferase type 11 domain-containing protein n=1 Tax=Diploscapter pachys TaxID=2018661 RepID=A0A2A2L0F3_9BILA|nr:hypothetical protein WR25_08715 [Diploscapter pachys]
MSVSHASLEGEYVHNVYSRLATYQPPDKPHLPSPRVWPKVTKFVESQKDGCLILDVGCGEAKYSHPTGHVIGIDSCPDILMSPKQPSVDRIIAHAISLPFRNNCADALLNVSVLHHLSTVKRRRKVLEECGRVMKPGAQMLLYVWAFEQPNGSFNSQDLLVPWNLHETSINGRLPKVKFHKNSTKEQRIIENSISISAPSESPPNQTWLNSFMNKVSYVKNSLPSSIFSTSASPSLPNATPRFYPNASKNSIILGIKRWSPMLSRRLASMIISVEEQYADELTDQIMRDSITETMATLRDVSFYRFYHVFKRGELEELIESTGMFLIQQTTFEHGNWCVIAEKIDIQEGV